MSAVVTKKNVAASLVKNSAKGLFFGQKKPPKDFESFCVPHLIKTGGLLGFFLFEELLVLVVELIDATGAVNELHLTSIEGV